MPIAVTAISNANNNLSQNKPGCNYPICTQNRNRLISPSIIPVDPTTITTTISPINTFPNNNNMPIVNTSVDYDNNNSNLPIPGCNCPACSQNRNKFNTKTLSNSLKIKPMNITGNYQKIISPTFGCTCPTCLMLLNPN